MHTKPGGSAGIDITAARTLVMRHLRQLEARMNSFGSGLPSFPDRKKSSLVVVAEQEYDFGWVFRWNSKEYIESGNVLESIAGNAPLIVDRFDGELYVTGTARGLESYIEEYRIGQRRRADHEA